MDGGFPTTPRSLADLASEITELMGHLNAATHRWLRLVAEFDTRKGWVGAGTQSCAHWLNWKCGIAMGVAREKVRVAHALADLPMISAAMARGQLSYSKVRELTRVACCNTESYLLNIALHGTADHVEKVVRHFRRAKEAAELSREAAQQANRFLSWHYDDDGSLVMKARLPAESGALVLKALQAAMESVEGEPSDVPAGTSKLSENVPAGTSTVKSAHETTPRMRRADALAVMAESFLAYGAEALNGGDKHQIVVHVAAETLRHDHAGCCEIEEGPSIAAETARRLSCDASVVTIVENDLGEPLNVGRKTRSIHPALRRALKARDKGCRFPGCTNTRFVDAHHIHHWADGGETKQSNLLSLCRFHHRLVHEVGIAIERLHDGAVRFVRPEGQCFESRPPVCSGDWTSIRAPHVHSGTATSRWAGERMDYGLAVQVLLQQESRVPAVLRSTSMHSGH
ncbi:MAG: DUF222 domain-containing protein [Steroidobacteraceae bacterium]